MTSSVRTDKDSGGALSPVPVLLMRFLSWTIVIVSAVALSGWLTGLRALTSGIPGLPTMKVNTALGFLTVAVGLVCPYMRHAALRFRGAGLLVVLFMALSLSQYYTGINMGIDEFFWSDPYSVVFPGRPSQATCLTFVLIGLLMVTTPGDGTGFSWWTSVLMVTGALVPLTAIITYMTDVGAILASGFFETMSVPTAMLFLASYVAMLLRGMSLQSAVQQQIGWRQFERLLLPVVVAPLVLGLVIYHLIDSGKLGISLGLGLFIAVFMLVAISALIWNSTLEASWFRRLKDEQDARLTAYRKLSSILETIHGGVVYLSASGVIRECNSIASDMLGYPNRQLIGRKAGELIPSEYRGRFERAVKRALADPELRHYRHKTFRVYLRQADGQQMTVLISVGPVEQPAGSVLGALIIKAEMLEQQFRQLQKEVRTDHLTSAGNRASLESRLTELENYGARQDQPVGFIMMDIDHFKAINDSFGHLCGDQILADFARRVDDSLRYSDSLYRYGGEEFLAVVVGAKTGALEALAERIRQKIAGHPFLWQDDKIAVTCSLGVAMHLPGESYQQTLERVDAGLYQAKDAGRNRVIVV